VKSESVVGWMETVAYDKKGPGNDFLVSCEMPYKEGHHCENDEGRDQLRSADNVEREGWIL